VANHAAIIRAENEGLPITRKGRRFLEFALPDGRRRFVTAIEPLHTRTTEAEIDATWYPDTGAWQWKIGDNDWQAHARSVFNVGNLIEWRHESDEWVVVDPQSINWINRDTSRQQIAIKQSVTGTTDDCTLTFANAYGAGRHFSYTAHPKRLIKHFTLDAPLPAPEPWLTGTIWLEVEWSISNSAGVELWLDGVRWTRTNGVRVQTSNSIEFRSEATGEVLWTADSPHATDANGSTVQAQYEVHNQSNNYFIRVRVPREWLIAATYPVTVDPTFTDGYGGDVQTYKDTIMRANSSTSNYGVWDLLQVGNDDSNGVNRGLIQFDLSSISPGVTVDSATMTLYKAWYDTASNNRAMQCYRVRRAWLEGTRNDVVDSPATGATWVRYDLTNNWSTAGCGDTTNDREASSIGSATWTTGEALGTSHAYTLSTAAVSEWIDGDFDNNGMLLQMETESDDAYNAGSSDHATTGYRPILVVEYTEAASIVPVAMNSYRRRRT